MQEPRGSNDNVEYREAMNSRSDDSQSSRQQDTSSEKRAGDTEREERVARKQNPDEPRRGRQQSPAPDRPRREDPHGPPPTSSFAFIGALIKDLFVTAIIIGVVISLLFGVSGVWPPLVAVESDSMEPQIMTGDLVFVSDTNRLVGEGAVAGTGVVPADRGGQTGYEKFGGDGDVIIFSPNGGGSPTPIIHRAHFWVEAGENWADRANPDLVSGGASCEAIKHCPAPHAGFITHGDNNRYYDQDNGQTGPVKPEWVLAKAQLRIPWLGNIRLIVSALAPVGGILGIGALVTLRG